MRNASATETARSEALSTDGRTQQAGRGRRRLGLVTAALAASALVAGTVPALAADDATTPAGPDATRMVEEERMAGDLYRAFAERYPDAVAFTRVASSEDRHLAAVQRVTGATAGTEAGVYADQTIQSHYNDWLTRGEGSCEAALEAAIELETADVADLAQTIKQAEAAGTPTRVWENLRRASEQHLAIFSTPGACEGQLPAGTGPHGQKAGQAGQNGQGNGQGRGQGAQCAQAQAGQANGPGAQTDQATDGTAAGRRGGFQGMGPGDGTGRGRHARGGSCVNR